MLVNPLLLAATAAVSLLPSLVDAAPIATVVHHEDGSVVIGIDSTDNHGNVLGKRNVVLESFAGCEVDQKESIIGSWRSMLEMAALIKDKVNFNEQVARDYLGDPSLNKGYQNAITVLIGSVGTWELGSGFLGWRLQMRCDDIERKRQQQDQRFPYRCPEGTKEEDWEKCKSRCWQAVSTRGDDDVPRVFWKPHARAYTTNPKDNRLGYMNWCPEYAMVHELFHIDANWKHHLPDHSHIMDRRMSLYDLNIGGMVTKDAYGPIFGKVLARWSGSDVGHLVATNADSLALYFLGKWVLERYNVYPNEPGTGYWHASKIIQPEKRDDTPDVWDPLQVVDGKVALGDLNDLAIALGAESREEAQTLYNDDPDACLDLVAEDENDENPVCADEGEVVQLYPTEESLEAGPVEPIPAGPEEGLPAGPVEEPVEEPDDALTAGPVEEPSEEPEAAPAEEPVVVTVEETETIPAEVPDDALTAGPVPIPNEGAEVIPNKAAHSSIPSNSTAHQ
ncbi:hypothetical protein ACHAPT_013656 [Fusarium lateritium]